MEDPGAVEGRPRPVEIAPYDSEWPARFERERAAAAAALGAEALAIEHIGSTAVPDLAAKAIVDMMVGGRRLAPAARYARLLAALDFAHDPERSFLDAHLFRKPASAVYGEEEVHLFVTERSGAWWREKLAFRDWLRSHPEDMRAYEVLKLRLAAAHGSDRWGYATAKTEFVQGILRRALGKRPEG